MFFRRMNAYRMHHACTNDAFRECEGSFLQHDVARVKFACANMRLGGRSLRDTDEECQWPPDEGLGED